jgi:acylphosphatase
MNQVSVRVRITGRVQGVGYRGWTVQAAVILGLSGWVRNRSDGSVEAVFQGGQDQIDQMIDKLYQGPFGAVVSCMTFDYETLPKNRDFKQIATS